MSANTITRSIEFLKPLIDSHFAKNKTPFIIGISGPQGSGKSYLSSNLSQKLSQEVFPELNTVDISTDDFYLTYEDQIRLQASHPDNWMLSGRGPLGTHDLKLLNQFLRQVSDGVEDLKIPRYDKSAHLGKGDRRPEREWTQLSQKIDVLIVEGWFNGFKTLKPDEVLLSRWLGIKLSQKRYLKMIKSDEEILTLNEFLARYEQIWDFFQVFIYLSTDDLSNVYQWRLEQEHNLKLSNGGVGMTDLQVEAFIDRYMPSYDLYYRDLQAKGCVPQKNRNLKLEIDKTRTVARSEII